MPTRADARRRDRRRWSAAQGRSRPAAIEGARGVGADPPPHENSAAIAADKKPRRLNSDVEPPVRGMSHPGALYRRLALGVSQPLARMGPCSAAVIRLPHSRPEPRVAAGRVNGPVCEVGGDIGQRPVLAQWPTHAPIAALAVVSRTNAPFLEPISARTFMGGLPLRRPRRRLGSRSRQDRAASSGPCERERPPRVGFEPFRAWGGRKAGDRVNIEVDQMARHAARLTEAR